MTTIPTVQPTIITVVQPYIPDYRVPLFDGLAVVLAQHERRLQVVHGGLPPGQAARGDAKSAAWSKKVACVSIRLGSRRLRYRSIIKLARRSRVVVSEFQTGNLDTYLLALFPGVRLMLTGHGKNYVTSGSRMDVALASWLARRAEHIFVYTQGGADYLMGRRIPAHRITVLQNSTDTKALRAVGAALQPNELVDFRARIDVATDSVVAAFVGAFDESKRLPLLFDAADEVHRRLPNFRLLVAGAGPLEHLVKERAGRAEYIRVLPRADHKTLALIGRIADVVTMPGRVGLIAVDALALGVPVITTDYPFHAPEVEYLDETNSVRSEGTPLHYADAISTLLLDPQRLKALSDSARKAGERFTIEHMVDQYSAVLADA